MKMIVIYELFHQNVSWNVFQSVFSSTDQSGKNCRWQMESEENLKEIENKNWHAFTFHLTILFVTLLCMCTVRADNTGWTDHDLFDPIMSSTYIERAK